MELLYGIIIALLLCGAFISGYIVRGRTEPPKPPQPKPEETERRNLEEENEAFARQMAYNIDIVYGVKK